MRKMLFGLMAAGLALLGFATAATADTTGAQTFVIVFRGPGTTPVAAAYGPVAGVGTNVGESTVRGPGGTFTSVDRVVLPQGSVVITNSGVHEQTMDERTCVATIREHGTVRFTGGTGAYAGATGSGTFDTPLGTVVGVRDSNGVCTLGPGSVGVVVIRVTGTITIPTTAAA